MLDIDFAENTHAHVMNQKKGAGLWVWKPYSILATLRDPTVPWGAHIVYLDAGNHYIGDLREFVKSTL